VAIDCRILSLFVGFVGVSAPAISAWAGQEIALVVKDAAGNDLHDVRVSIDGQLLVDHVEGQSLTIDLGEHHLRFEAAGFNDIETTVVAQEAPGQRQHKLRVLVFMTPASTVAVAARDESSPHPVAPGLQLTPSSSPGNAEPRAMTPRWRRPVAGALLGASGASLVLGTVWSFLAKSEYDHALTTECGGNPTSCSAQGIADGRTAHDRAMVSTVAFVGAAVFLAGAATVYFAWPGTQERVAVAPTVNTAGAGVTLTW
jgi:hypothetical protein